MIENTQPHRPLMIQAPVRALDPDGVAVVSAGTIAFAIGSVVCWVFWPHLAAIGKLWYLGVAVAGTVLGLLGLTFGIFRGRRRSRSAGHDAADATSVE